MVDMVLYEGDTALDHYQVVDTVYEGRPARVLYSGTTGRTAQSGVAQDGEPDLLFDYNQRFLELLESVPARRLLLIGGGAYTLPMALLVDFPELTIDVVEVDAGLQPIAEKFFGLKPSKRLHIIHDDGRHYLDTATEHYDVILLDAFSQSSVPSALTEPAAIRQVHGHLKAGGVAAMNIISPYYGPNTDLIKKLSASYESAFDTVDIYPAGKSLFSLWLPQNLVLVAQKGKLHELHLRYGKLND